MKKTVRIITAAALVLLGAHTMTAQQRHYTTEKSLAERVGLIEQKQDRFNLYLNTHMSADFLFNNDGFDQGHFNGRQLRLEARGNVTDWLSFRWRQRLNRGNAGNGHIDNLPTSIDIAGIGVQMNDRWSLFLGKQCAAYGGIEFDLNPIEIYEYSNMIEYMSNFLTGVNIAYQVAPGQQLQLQILNGRNGAFENTYPELENSIQEVKLPWVYTFNWNGTIAPFWSTRWSYSIMNQAKDDDRNYNMHYFALGNQFNFDKFGGFFDAMYSNEGLNRKFIIDSTKNVEYLSLVLKMNYRIDPNWNVFLKGMYETAGAAKPEEDNKSTFFKYDTQMTSYGYLAGLEYYPFEDDGLHFFLTYVGRSHDISGLEKNINTHRLSLGFIYQLPLF